MKKISFLLIYILITIYFGYSQSPWTGKFKLAYDTNNSSIIYLQVVPDNTGNGDLEPGTIAYIKLPSNTTYTAVSINGVWGISTKNSGLAGETDCGMVIECKMNGQYPAEGVGTENTVNFTVGEAVDLVKITLTNSCSPGATYRLYENSLIDVCTSFNDASLENGISVEGDSFSYTGNLTTYSNPLMCPNAACAWQTKADGNWETTATWQYKDCNTLQWVNSPVAPNNDAPIYVYHNVEIPSATTITTASILTIEPSGKLKVSGALNANNKIVIRIDKSGDPGELNNGTCPGGTVTMGGAANIVVRKIFDLNKWAFISFPFDISETNIYHNGSAITSWGNPGGSGKNLYVAEYDGAARSAETGDLSLTTGKYFVAVPGTSGSRTLTANKGYIMASSNTVVDSIDFIAATNTQFNFCTPVQVNTSYTSGSIPCNSGWNFVGTPFISTYDLTSATGLPNHYVHDGTTYQSTTNTVKPFSAYFVHVTSAGSFTYETAGKQLAKEVTNTSPTEEFILNYSNSSYTDNTTIRLKEDAGSGFNLNEDAVKILSSSVTIPQIYTELPEACGKIAINSLPSDTNRVNLVVRNGSVGDFTISMSNQSKLTALKQAILVDTETGLRTDLLTTSYTYNNFVPGTSSSRFYILFSPDNTTDIAPKGNSDISVIPTGRNIRLNGLKGVASVNMYDVVGKLIYQYTDIAEGQSFNVNVPGVYVMDISTESQRTRIKILINN